MSNKGEGMECLGCKLANKKEKVFKGMRGVVMGEEPINGCWYVIFSENGTGIDIADILVRAEHLEVIL